MSKDKFTKAIQKEFKKLPTRAESIPKIVEKVKLEDVLDDEFDKKMAEGNDIPALAKGGIVTGPTLALIGEGRESEAVIPLSKLDAMMTGGRQNVIVHGRISGQDILLSSEKATRTRSRYRGF